MRSQQPTHRHTDGRNNKMTLASFPLVQLILMRAADPSWGGVKIVAAFGQLSARLRRIAVRHCANILIIRKSSAKRALSLSWPLIFIRFALSIRQPLIRDGPLAQHLAASALLALASNRLSNNFGLFTFFWFWFWSHRRQHQAKYDDGQALRKRLLWPGKQINLICLSSGCAW